MDGMRLSHDEKTEMEVQLLEYIYESFEKEASIDFINLVAVQNLENYLLNLIGPINDYDGWLASRKDIKTKILEFQIQ